MMVGRFLPGQEWDSPWPRPGAQSESKPCPGPGPLGNRGRGDRPSYSAYWREREVRIDRYVRSIGRTILDCGTIAGDDARDLECIVIAGHEVRIFTGVERVKNIAVEGFKTTLLHYADSFFLDIPVLIVRHLTVG